MMKIKILGRSCLTAVLLVVLGQVACTKYENPPAIFEDQEDGRALETRRKVLFISVDGAVGAVVKDVMPANIAAMLPSSKYTFDALADENTGDAASWMTMMSGVSSNAHHIEDDSFIPKPDEHDHHANAAGYPSLLYRMATLAPSLRSYVVARNAGISNRLLVSASESYHATSDEETKDVAVELLKSKISDVLLLQFTDVLDAGKSGGFSAENSGYVDALNRVDGYIGEVMAALKARENFEFEDWLIIITSNHGGLGDSYGGDSAEERNIFAVFQNPRFKGLELFADKMEALRFFGFYDPLQANYAHYGPSAFRGRNNPVDLAAEKIYDAANTGELTVEAKIKMNAVQGGYAYALNTPFLGKNAQRTGSTPGWAFFKSGASLTFYAADGATKIESGMGAVSSAGEWAHITAVLLKVNNVPTAKLYVNGALVASPSNSSLNMSNVASSTGLTFGYFPYIFSGLPIDVQLCDVHIWNSALSDSEVAAHANRIGLPDNALQDSRLVGYWPMDQLVNNTFANKLSGKPAVAAQGSTRKIISANDMPFADPNAVLFQSTDVFTQIFYWMQLQAQDTWNLEGQVFLNRFEAEFLVE
ncbi:LamG-like jellyroll fold domain-containing protein [Sphingobacterium griseoflavum]|uniref:DUF4983 domain-containing protein n=1 Tax=Sphingobacterium griseoflavum TaxID=1474952 RepID=A0ABQ3HVS4_9SPHI|nr:LamG-like jellyroll fold domain-containing protein [Sphingobacterium griseoflavum]GHE39472.1 hypothetical protein GCM10017764_23390 [Sphingobacterium griseoflavum]